MFRVRSLLGALTTLALAIVLIFLANPARGVDELGEKELAAGRDPSFESVSSHFQAMKRPREAIGVKTHRDEFVITPDGWVNFMPVRSNHWRGHTGENSGNAFFTLSKPSVYFGRGDSGPAVKRLVEGYMPIVIADFQHDGLKYEQTAVAWSEGMSPDEPLWAFVRLKVINPGKKAREVQLRWHADYGAKKERKVRTVVSWTFELPPGAEKTVYGKLPYLDGYEQATEGSAAEFDEHLAEATAVCSYFNPSC
jgi:hypothetical protein